ncbi:MAG: hypothetical protein BV457_04315 [Thermoplasmata archaeon M9B1D]|nr:MAG: hypothetical protein BV457_04315 [Thermoplasmata archaeon M9B1D]PNX50876.1 MAG: hypothetical protein BV456_05215 [Thermoplasmata archaeon M8B2D]
MKKIFAILMTVCLLAVTVSGLAMSNEADEKDQNIDEATLKITSITKDKDTSDFVLFDGKEYYLPAFPEKTQDQIDKMIQNPQMTVSMDDLPGSFSWLSFGGNWMTPAKDQQNCGSCWAFGALGGLEAAINIAKGDPDFDRDLSEQYILSCLPAAGSCSGGWMSEAIEYIKSDSPGSSGNGINGCPLESCMYYTATDYVPCDDKCTDWNYYTDPPEEDNILWQVQDFGVTQLTPTNPDDWTLLKTWLVTYGPVIVDIYASSGWSSFWGSHHSSTDVYQGTESGTTNHAQVLCGWVDDDSIMNGGYWIIKNSWGTGFGYQGFSNIAYGTLRLGDRDVTWVTAPEWPEAENPPDNPLFPVYHVYSDWEFSPETPKLGTEIQFQDQSRGPVVLWEWDFDGDGEFDLSGTDHHAENPKWTYTSEGTYQVSERVWASGGLSSVLTKNVVVKQIWPPVAVSKPSYYGGEDNEVYFDGRFSYDVDGTITAYAWDFNGDGTIDTTQQYYTYTYPNQNGQYSATLKVTDNEGATNTVTIPVNIDKTQPPVTSAIVGGVDQDNEAWFNDDVVVELKTTDWSGVSRLYFKIDNGEWSETYCHGVREFSGTFKIRKSTTGLHTVQYYAVDIHGNVESTKTVNVGIDLTDPSMNVVLNGEKNGDDVYITPVQVTINANDVDSGVETIVYKINNGDWVDYLSPFTINQGGSHTVDIIVEDKAGNTIQGTFTVKLEYGPTKPIISGPSKGTPNVEYTFSFTSYDENNDQIAYYVDWGDGSNTGWTSFVNSGKTEQFKHTWTEEKSYTLQAKAKDINGAESDWATQTISLPKTRDFMFGRFLNNFPLLQRILSLPFFQNILKI